MALGSSEKAKVDTLGHDFTIASYIVVACVNCTERDSLNLGADFQTQRVTALDAVV